MGAVYNVRVVPVVPILIMESTSRQLTIPYNSQFILSVEAAAPCRTNATTSTVLRLNYGRYNLN